MSDQVLDAPVDTTQQATEPTQATPMATPAPSPATPAPSSLLAKGAAAAPSPAPAAGDVPASQIPAKYVVKREDGTVDLEASAAKLAEGYGNLERRLGSGDAPPAKPEDYQIALTADVSMDALKADPLFQGFLKGAHSRGMNNAQVSYVIESFQQRMAMANSPEVGEAELRKVWTTDDQMARGLADSYRAAQAFAGPDKTRAERIEKKFGNDPDFVWLMAQVGRELEEDTSAAGALSGAEQQSLESLMASKAYSDHKDPEHAQTVAKVRALYAKRFPQG